MVTKLLAPKTKSWLPNGGQNVTKSNVNIPFTFNRTRAFMNFRISINFPTEFL